MKEKILTVTIKDCRVDTMRGSGNGGQNRNKRDTAVRVTHEPSGAVGYSEEHKTQLPNKKTAFRRMAESDKFKLWIKLEAGMRVKVEEEVEKAMSPSNLRTEIRENNRWKTVDVMDLED